ncbi:hypothetical protein RCG67_15990 [Kocuria sp. CPCC 205292]|uniref:hypothetical protein n=1 Tax=Kocuria cellulosilytica TaxID=3071451 RepID=UPI0034D772FA
MSRLALAVRWLGPLSVLLTVLFFDLVGASVMMLVCLAVTITWRARLPAALEITTDLTLLLAAWSSVFLLYEKLEHWDLVVHFAATAVLAELAFRALERWSRLSPPGPVSHVVVVSSLGAALALVWEYLEFAGFYLVDPQVNVGYLDTMGDLAAGHAGSLVAGILGTWARQRAGAGGNPRATEPPAGTERPDSTARPAGTARPGSTARSGTVQRPGSTDEQDTTEKKD